MEVLAADLVDFIFAGRPYLLYEQLPRLNPSLSLFGSGKTTRGMVPGTPGTDSQPSTAGRNVDRARYTRDTEPLDDEIWNLHNQFAQSPLTSTSGPAQTPKWVVSFEVGFRGEPDRG